MAKKKIIKAYKAMFSLVWFKDELKGSDMIHKNGRVNKELLKEEMANELVKAMRDVTIDESLPISIEFEELEVDEEGYNVI